MQVRRLSEIWHRNVVTLIGYCQEGGLQMLVFEYLPNGSVCRHLYGNDFSRASTVALLTVPSVSRLLNVPMNPACICSPSDTGKEALTRLEFKQRHSIAIAAAKGNETVKPFRSFSSLVRDDVCVCAGKVSSSCQTNSVSEPHTTISESQVWTIYTASRLL
jgi:hypothetical protein